MEINRTEFIEVLKIVRPGLADKELIEQSTSFAFNEGRITTYNDEISISHPLPSLNDLTGAVSSKELYELLEKIKNDTVEVDIDSNQLKLNSGRIKAGIVMDSQILLPLEEISADKEWIELPETFIEALKFTVYSCSSDISSPVITCIHIRGDMVESTDNIRLAQFRLDKKLPVESLLIPGKSIKDVINYSIKWISTDKSWAHFMTEKETIISCRIIEAKYPKTEHITDVQGDEIEFPSSVTDILSRAEVFSDRDHPLDEEVEVELSDRRITIKSKSDIGWFEESARFRYSGETISFIVHPTFLKNICQQKSTCIVSSNRLKFYSDNWEQIIALKEIS